MTATATLLSALGLVALSSCVESGSAPSEAEITAALTGTTFNWVDNLANLRLMAHTTTSPIVVVQGYNAPNDGGVGIFWWDAGATAADNDGTIIRPSNVAVGSPGRWRRLFSGPVNVRWFGAGLGLGADLTRITSGLALLIAAGGGVLFFPAGTYAISGSIAIKGATSPSAATRSARACWWGQGASTRSS